MIKESCPFCNSIIKIDKIEDVRTYLNCSVCGSHLEVYASTSVEGKAGSKDRCFNCKYYKQIECRWDYGEEYGRCTHTKNDEKYDDKYIHTICNIGEFEQK